MVKKRKPIPEGRRVTLRPERYPRLPRTGTVIGYSATARSEWITVRLDGDRLPAGAEYGRSFHP